MSRTRLSKRPVPAPRPLVELFAECDGSFRSYLTDLAERHGKPVLAVYGWWREHTRDCSAYDQSPVTSEFEQWYAAKLRSPLAN